MKDGGPAFPRNWDDGSSTGHLLRHDGMSLRDYFAIHCDQPGRAEITSEAGLFWRKGLVYKFENDNQVEEGRSFESWWGTLDNPERFRLYVRVRLAMADAYLTEREK